jgi:hypothetical protein
MLKEFIAMIADFYAAIEDIEKEKGIHASICTSNKPGDAAAFKSDKSRGGRENVVTRWMRE